MILAFSVIFALIQMLLVYIVMYDLFEGLSFIIFFSEYIVREDKMVLTGKTENCFCI